MGGGTSSQLTTTIAHEACVVRTPVTKGLRVGPRVSDPPELKASPSRRGHTTPHKRTGGQSRPDYRDCASARTRQAEAN